MCAPNVLFLFFGYAVYVLYVCRGATCYLNSLIQAMYMTPELRLGLFAIDPAELGVDVDAMIGADEVSLCGVFFLFSTNAKSFIIYIYIIAFSVK